MLAGVLLYVVAAALGIDLTANADSRLNISQRCFEVVDDFAVFGVVDFGNPESRFGVCSIGRHDPACVKNLAAARWIEGGAVKDKRRAWSVEDFADLGIEVIEERVAIVKAFRH